MKKFSKIVLALFLGVWTSNLAASELNSFAENTDAYVLNDCSFEEKLLATDALYFVKIPLKGTFTLHGCTMTYDITVSYSVIQNQVTNISGNISFSGACSGSIDFDIDMRSNSDGTINELPVFDEVDVDNKTEFEQHLVSEINRAITK
ncbi:hypothetical protein [Winogradskyella sp. SYSU M77433]|uniref:hypothetical protein n=1 Tax=Winogradskyella sp. SYSU M77433 TaxID=3042722 RepID=UPI0024809BA4|nr:hypothetical protein [Winogradskyella sp. SYSU M77433]MDH7913451.1 hypothetical protein [Winogradskyella sp. SYSU M77433]